VGMAICSTVYSIFNSYHAVFIVNAIIAVIVLVVAWLTIAPRREAAVASSAAG
jgi:hypothetical protein